MLASIFTLDSAITLITLSVLEIILGIDNIVLIAILTGRLKPKNRAVYRRAGVAIAVITRIMLLAAIFWLISFTTTPLFSLFSYGFSVRHLVLFFGGVFLIYKSTQELYEEIFHHQPIVKKDSNTKAKYQAPLLVMTQIAFIDIVFSLDSVITAVGIADQIEIMVLAILISVAVMLLAVNPICRIIEKYPSIKRLALAFLFMIGIVLILEGIGIEVAKPYIYVTLLFATFVESINILAHSHAHKHAHKHVRKKNSPKNKA